MNKKLFFLLPFFLLIFTLNAHGWRTEYNKEHGYEIHFPEGETTCAYGKPFAFYVKRGTENKVLLDFLGGGACWSEWSCKTGFFRKDVDPEGMAKDYKKVHGLYRRDIAENPFKNWTHITVGYCTGDLHWGDRSKTYGSGSDSFIIHHKGAVNTQETLKWMFKEFSNPENIFITGTSAGAYASIYWAPTIIEEYKNKGTKIHQMGDSGAGIVTRDFVKESFPSWNAFKHAPKFVPGISDLERKVASSDFKQIYYFIAKHYPNVNFSQFNFAYDQGQIFFFEAMLEESEEDIDSEEIFRKRVELDTNYLYENLPNFTSFLAPGEIHTVIDKELFYTLQFEGHSLYNWITNMVFKDQNEQVICQKCLLED